MTQTWDDYLNNVEAEIDTTHPEPELSEEERRHQERTETAEIVNRISIPGALTGMPREGTTPLPLGPDATAAEIAARIRP